MCVCFVLQSGHSCIAHWLSGTPVVMWSTDGALTLSASTDGPGEPMVRWGAEIADPAAASWRNGPSTSPAVMRGCTPPAGELGVWGTLPFVHSAIQDEVVLAPGLDGPPPPANGRFRQLSWGKEGGALAVHVTQSTNHFEGLLGVLCPTRPPACVACPCHIL